MGYGGILRTTVAEADIDQHAAFLAETNIDAGIRFYNAVDATLKTLASMPGIGSPRRLTRIAEIEVRIWPVQGFPDLLILYREVSKGIEILRVLHSRRNWSMLFS